MNTSARCKYQMCQALFFAMSSVRMNSGIILMNILIYNSSFLETPLKWVMSGNLNHFPTKI